MIIYWTLMLIPIAVFFTPIRVDKMLSNILWTIYWIFLTLVIGLRHEVGGDWNHYLYDNALYSSLSGVGFFEIFTMNNILHDIGFLTIHWFSQNIFNGIYTTNLICAAIFVSGLLRICKSTPVPSMALAIAVPYLIVVVAMGYTRQAAAIGFIMWGLVDLMYGNKGKFYISVILAILFHKTALMMMFFGLFSRDFASRAWSKKDYLIIVLMLIFVDSIYEILEHMVYFYITNTDMASSGAFVRVSMCVVTALLFLVFKKSWDEVYEDGHIWKIFSIAVIMMLPLVFLISTTIDRLALYLIPMQIVIFPRVLVLISNHNIRHLFLVSILTIYALTLYVWINYATHSVYWLPYDNILL